MMRPYYSLILQSLNKVKVKIVFKNTSNLDLFPWMISCWWGLLALGLLSRASPCISFSLHRSIQETRMRTVTCSSFVNISWFSLILGWRDVVHWSCKLEFLHDGLCLLVAWWRVILSNMPAVLMVEGGTFIGSCVKASSPMTLGCHLATMVVHNLMRHHQQSSIDMMFVNMRMHAMM